MIVLPIPVALLYVFINIFNPLFINDGCLIRKSRMGEQAYLMTKCFSFCGWFCRIPIREGRSVAESELPIVPPLTWSAWSGWTQVVSSSSSLAACFAASFISASHSSLWSCAHFSHGKGVVLVWVEVVMVLRSECVGVLPFWLLQDHSPSGEPHYTALV